MSISAAEETSLAVSRSRISKSKLKDILQSFLHRFMLIFTLIYILPYAQGVAAFFVPFLEMVWNFSFYFGAIISKFFGPKYAYVITPDSHYQYAVCFSSVIVSLCLTFVWTLLHRGANFTIFWWWSNILRISLAVLLIFYGMYKVFPVQMPEPNEVQLMLRLNELSPIDYLWEMMGFSPAYQMISGWIEVIGAVFMLIPRLITMGGLISFIVMIQVALLNYCYDIPVKLVSTWMCLGELILLAPALKRLSLYLLGKIALTKLQKKQIISVKSNTFRRYLIIMYSLASVFFIFQVALVEFSSYRSMLEPQGPLAGGWMIQSITNTSQDDGLATRLHAHDWEIIAIVQSKNDQQIHLSTFTRIGKSADWMGESHSNQLISLENMNENEKISMRYDLPRPGKSGQKIIFNVYGDASKTPGIIISAQKMLPPKYHPGEFHWIQDAISGSVS